MVKALLIDIDPKAGWANALVRSSGKAHDPNTPPAAKKSRRHRQAPEQPAAI